MSGSPETSLSHDSQTLGTPPSHDGSLGSPCRNTKKRAWFFTWNNYDMNSEQLLKNYFGDSEYVIGHEVGKQGTPHLQGNVRFSSPRSFQSLHNKFPKVHWEICKNWIASKQYCKKDGDFSEKDGRTLLEIKLDEHMHKKYDNVVWKPWQENVLKIIQQEADERTVFWFWEPTGNIGKSFLAKYIAWKYKTVIVNGKQNDVFHGIKSYLETKKDFPEVVIVDIPRVNANYVCYGTMEKIKDGLFYSGKYEGGMILLIPCHLIVFANFEPDTSTMSRDRWHIEKL